MCPAVQTVKGTQRITDRTKLHSTFNLRCIFRVDYRCPQGAQKKKKKKDLRCVRDPISNSHLAPEGPRGVFNLSGKNNLSGEASQKCKRRFTGNGLHVTGDFFVSLRSYLNSNCLCEDLAWLLIMLPLLPLRH